MSYASRSGRALTSSKKPQAFGVCFRCGIWYNRVYLNFQYEWRGTSLQNLYILVCDRCLDVPQEQLRAIILPPDPTPIYFPSVEQFQADETDYRTVLPTPKDPITGLPIPANAAFRVTEDGLNNRTTQPIGAPNGLEQPAVMPYNGGIKKAFGTALSLLSVTADGSATISVTCSKAHGLQTDDQISAEGLSDANGFYSVTVLTATAFQYTVADDVAAGSLLTSAARIITALVGLPYGAAQIPLTVP